MKDIRNLVGRVAAQAGEAGRDRTGDARQGEVALVAPKPLSPFAETVIAALDAPLVRIEKPDPRWPKGPPMVSYGHRPLPRGAENAVAEIEARLAAFRAMLAPASQAVVGPWVMLLASRTNFRSRGAEAQAEIGLATMALCEPDAGLPDACFDEQTIWTVVDRTTEPGKRWFPPAAAIRDALRPITKPVRDEIERLERLLALLQERSPGNLLAAPRPGEGEVYTDAEVDAWIQLVGTAPANFLRMRQCARYLATLAKSRPDLSDERRGQLEALRDAPYGEDVEAQRVAKRNAAAGGPPTAEQRAAAEALRQRRLHNQAEAENKRLATLNPVVAPEAAK